MPLIKSKFIETGLINQDFLTKGGKEIINKWLNASWKIGYNILPLLIRQSSSEDETTDKLPNNFNFNKPTGSGQAQKTS